MPEAQPEQSSDRPIDSQYALALSIARAVQTGLPHPDSEEAVRSSVRDAVRFEACRNELTLAYLRCALAAACAVIAGVAYMRPEWSEVAVVHWPTAGALLGVWGLAAATLAILLRRGWYRAWLRRVVPLADAVVVTTAFLLLDLNFGRYGLGASPGPFLGAAAACAFIAFSGALRLSRRAAQTSTVLALAAWVGVVLIGGVPAGAALVTGAFILFAGFAASQVTRIIRRVITDEVTRLRLTVLYQQAQEAIDTREEVLRIVSHDLRNPLGTIGLAADLILEEPLSEGDRRRYLGIIKRQGETMKHLVNDLLDAARVEAGRLPIEPKATSVADLLAGVMEMMQPHAADKGIILEASTEADLPPVWADPDRVVQVFSNLVGNAIKFTPERGRITVTATPSNGKVRFAVRDTGPGIPAEDLSNIFGRMWQAQKSDGRGIGLGLTIAQSIVRAHGEEIGVDSKVGEGTEFWFYLGGRGPGAQAAAAS